MYNNKDFLKKKCVLLNLKLKKAQTKFKIFIGLFDKTSLLLISVMFKKRTNKIQID